MNSEANRSYLVVAPYERMDGGRVRHKHVGEGRIINDMLCRAVNESAESP